MLMLPCWLLSAAFFPQDTVNISADSLNFLDLSYQRVILLYREAGLFSLRLGHATVLSCRLFASFFDSLAPRSEIIPTGARYDGIMAVNYFMLAR